MKVKPKKAIAVAWVKVGGREMARPIYSIRRLRRGKRKGKCEVEYWAVDGLKKGWIEEGDIRFWLNGDDEVRRPKGQGG